MESTPSNPKDEESNPFIPSQNNGERCLLAHHFTRAMHIHVGIVMLYIENNERLPGTAPATHQDRFSKILTSNLAIHDSTAQPMPNLYRCTTMERPKVREGSHKVASANSRPHRPPNQCPTSTVAPLWRRRKCERGHTK